MKKLLILASALVLAGCADVAPSAPARQLMPGAPSRILDCRSGYAVAYNSDGTAYCAPADSTSTMTTTATATTTTTSTTAAASTR